MPVSSVSRRTFIATSAATSLAATASAQGANERIHCTIIGVRGRGRSFWQPLANRKIWVMKGSADMALIDGGFTQTPYGSIMHHFMTACRQMTPECQKGLAAIEAKTAGSARTDATGRARTGALPPGRYYVFATLVVEDKPMVWQEPIDLHPGSNSLALDLNNAYPVE